MSFPDTQLANKITTENINIERSLNRLKKIVFFLWFFPLLISSLTQKFRSSRSDNEFNERSNEQWTWSSSSDQKQRNFRVRLEIKGKKKEKKNNFLFICATS